CRLPASPEPAGVVHSPDPVRVRVWRTESAAVPPLPRLDAHLPREGRAAPPGLPRAAGARPMTRLLVSVRSLQQANSALESGVGLIDVKEPARGSLGRADDSVLVGIVGVVEGRVPVSAALGELRDFSGDWPDALEYLAYVKWGPAGLDIEPYRKLWRQHA